MVKNLYTLARASSLTTPLNLIWALAIRVVMKMTSVSIFLMFIFLIFFD